MIDPADAESVINRVSTTLADRFTWLEKSDLMNEAYELCLERNLVARATSPGALHHWLRVDLIRMHQDEERQRNQTDSLEALADEHGDALGAWMTMTHVPEDTAPKHIPGQRSQLLDVFASMTKDEFMEWGKSVLGRKWGSIRDLRTLLYGHEREIEAMWARYAQNKKGYGKGGISGLTLEERRYPEETWRGYRRYGSEEWSVDDDLMIEDPYEWGSSRRWHVDQRAAGLFWPRPLRTLASA